jgi:hypothetical protein
MRVDCDLVVNRLVGLGLPVEPARRVADRVLSSIAIREENVLSPSEFENTILANFRAAHIRALRAGVPNALLRDSPGATPPPGPPWWIGPALTVGSTVIQSSSMIGDDVPPKLHGITGVATDGCCEAVEKGIKLKLTIDAEEIDDWGWTGGLSKITVGPINKQGEHVGQKAQVDCGNHIGRKTFEVSVCVPCIAVADGRASVMITVEDGSGNSVSERHSFPVKQEWRDQCCS